MQTTADSQQQLYESLAFGYKRMSDKEARNSQYVALCSSLVMMSGIGLCTAPFPRQCDATRESRLKLRSPSRVFLPGIRFVYSLGSMFVEID